MAIEAAAIETALQSGLPVYTGEFKMEWFFQQLATWHPDAIMVCGCGQIFDSRILGAARYGVYNFLTKIPWRATIPGRAGPCTKRPKGWTPVRSPPISVADAHGRIVRDPKRFYDKLKGVVGPMATILIEELARLGDGGPEGRVTRIDFEPRLPDGVKTHLRAPIA